MAVPKELGVSGINFISHLTPLKTSKVSNMCMLCKGSFQTYLLTPKTTRLHQPNCSLKPLFYNNSLSPCCWSPLSSPNHHISLPTLTASIKVHEEQRKKGRNRKREGREEKGEEERGGIGVGGWEWNKGI